MNGVHPVPAALLFDVFGTLVDWRGGVIDALRVFGERCGATADWGAFADAWRAAYAPSMDRVRSGRSTWRNLDALHRESLDTLLAQHELAAGDDERAALAHAWHALPPWPDVGSGLQRLRARFIVASLSNGNVALQVNLRRHAALEFDMLFSAELFRHYKPDPETYLGACRLLDLPPQGVMLVAAHPSDLRAAKSFGLQTAYIERPLEHGPAPAGGVRDRPAAGDEFDYTAPTLASLAEQLGA